MNSKRKYIEVNKMLGKRYKVIMIDFGWCLYKDFGNGYDVEVNIDGTIKNVKEIQIFLWEKNPFYNIKTYYCDKIDDINSIVDKLYEDTKKYSKPITNKELEYERKDALDQQHEFYQKKYPGIVFM